MKKIYILLVLSTTFSFAQIINIPDPNFKARLLAANASNGNACMEVQSTTVSWV